MLGQDQTSYAYPPPRNENQPLIISTCDNTLQIIEIILAMKSPLIGANK